MEETNNMGGLFYELANSFDITIQYRLVQMKRVRLIQELAMQRHIICLEQKDMSLAWILVKN